MVPLMKLNRNYGYDILINTFESTLRDFVLNEIFKVHFLNNWRDIIPKGITSEIYEINKDLDLENISIEDFFEELSLQNLKEICLLKNVFKFIKPFFGDIKKNKLNDVIDELNIYRRKITYAKSTFCNYDLIKIIEYIELLSQGEKAREIRDYLKNEKYKNANNYPSNFYEKYECKNNLPLENYNLDGGFVGREKELKAIFKRIKLNQDRINTITGAGGVGKTAIVLKIAYSLLADPKNNFDGIIWFSAKTSKLTDEGIVPINPDIRNEEQLITEILKVIDPKTLISFKDAKVPFTSYKNHLYNLFSSLKCLLIIDNLETILRDNALINFIKDIPRPSQVLITSKKGLGEIERRFPLTGMSEKDAIQLFRIIATTRNREDLLQLKENKISELVKRVKCYPLLIKLSIGQVCLGKDIDESFSEILQGDSEIATFIFNDVFNLLSQNAKLILFSMIVYGNEKVSRPILMHLANLPDEQFKDAIKELVLTSFIIPENKESNEEIAIEYSMLTLTRGFIERKLDYNEEINEMLSIRYHNLSEEIQEVEKVKTSYYQSLYSLGIKNPEEKVAFNYVKTAKDFLSKKEIDEAQKNFDIALKIAPKSSYVLIEYSKFEFYNGHKLKAIEYAKKAVEENPKSYHPWFKYGTFLRKNNNLEESINCLKKAKELNPNHLPIYNELGRAYTFIGYYDKAEAEFLHALKEEKYPNYRHKIMTLQFLSDNYKRKAEAFGMRMDVNGQINMLKKALETIQKALEIAPKDHRLWKYFRLICKELGVVILKRSGIEEARPYLEKCFQTAKFGKITIPIDREIGAEACFYLAALTMNENNYNEQELETYINRGLKYCSPDSKWSNKLKQLKEALPQKKPIRKIMKDRTYGIVKFYNFEKKFGIINAKEDVFTFILNEFGITIPVDQMDSLIGRKVSFIEKEHPNKKNKKIASNIFFEDD